MSDLENKKSILIAIAWCLGWGENRQLSDEKLSSLQQMRQALKNNRLEDLPSELKDIVDQVEVLDQLEFPDDLVKLKDSHKNKEPHKKLWEKDAPKIGLVYGGATKIKQYVFEAANLSDIRGASALLDRINLSDIPGFFEHPDGSEEAAQWLGEHFPSLGEALIPELLVYYKGGNILAFCPAAWADDLADAIEKRYTYETLTANSCAVGATFRPLEIYLGLLQDPIENTFWLDLLETEWRTNSTVRAYFGLPEPSANQPIPNLTEVFQSRKNFNELVGKLTTQFNQRRSGFDQTALNGQRQRPSRRYPPMFETHPYLVRDDSDRRSSVVQVPASQLPGEPKFSEPLARKHRVGQITKREETSDQWYKDAGFTWFFGDFDSWVFKFETFLSDPLNLVLAQKYHSSFPDYIHHNEIQEARSLREIGDASKGFVAYIYADGNNMGQYIRDNIKTPTEYRQFSEDIFAATTQATYYALAQHLNPHFYRRDADSSRTRDAWIHPFEIVTIGGDDVLLIVPANRALEITQTIGEKFEEILAQTGRYSLKQLPDAESAAAWHRYKGKAPKIRDSCLSISSAVLITAENTPIYYADKLYRQLLKSAKKKAKMLKDQGYFGGTVDILTLKAVTMISSNISAFRQEGLTISRQDPQTGREQVLKLYATPYTLHELGGLIETLRSLKQSGFPKSQLYQIRTLLERGRRTAILNYRYFRVRLSHDNRTLLENDFEAAWCEAETNNGNVAPWLTPHREEQKTTYETIWRELVDLLPFVTELDEGHGGSPSNQPATAEVES